MIISPFVISFSKPVSLTKGCLLVWY